MEFSRKDFLKLSLGGAAGLVLLDSPGKALAEESPNPLAKAVLVDTSKCVGCWWCYAACKKKNNLPETLAPGPEEPPQLDYHVWSTLNTKLSDGGWLYAKRQCMHCLYPACVAACPVGALQKTDDGPVVYYESKCIGCRYCMVACPFGIPTFEWHNPVPWIRKCNFCDDYLAEGRQPACVAACPTGALKFGQRQDLLTEAEQRIANEPAKYVDYIYGEKEAGGTSWLYITTVPIEDLAFPTPGSSQISVNAQRALNLVPPVLVGVAAAMAGIYWVTKHRQRTKEGAGGDKGEETH